MTAKLNAEQGLPEDTE